MVVDRHPILPAIFALIWVATVYVGRLESQLSGPTEVAGTQQNDLVQWVLLSGSFLGVAHTQPFFPVIASRDDLNDIADRVPTEELSNTLLTLTFGRLPHLQGTVSGLRKGASQFSQVATFLETFVVLAQPLQ